MQKYFLGEKLHGVAGADFFTANMYLAEDRVYSDDFLSICSGFTYTILDSLLGAGGEARWPMDPSLRQICVRGDGRPFSGSRIDFTAPKVAEWIPLRCHLLDRPLQLYLPFES